MNEKTTTVYICDLKIFDRAKRYLTRVGITTLNDLLNYDINELFVLYGFSDGVLHEIREVIGHSDTILRDFAERACRIADLLPSVKDIPIEKMKFGTRSYNALKKAGIHTVGSLIHLSQNDIFEMRNVGQQTRDNIISAINSVLDNGLTLFDKNESGRVVSAFEEDKRQQEGKDFDFAVIDILTKRFSLKAAKLAEWFELSRQSVYNAIEKQSPSRASKWTGKTLSEREIDILINLISNKSFDYKDDKMTCCCMNNRG